MNIPDEYRERYGNLARAHSWRQKCDEWKAKTEGSSKVRAGSSSAKRAAAVERLRDYENWSNRFDDTSLMKAVIGVESWGCTWQENRDALIDLLTDDEMPEVGKSQDSEIDSEINNGDLIAQSNFTQEEVASLSELSGNLSDSREKLEADVRVRSIRPSTYLDCTYDDVMRWLDRQAAITERELCAQCDWPSVAAQPDTEAYDRIDELTAERDSLAEELSKAQELCAARGKTIESLERFVADRKEKFKDQLVQKTEYCKTLKADRDQYRKLYEAAMSTDYAQVTRERDELREQIKQIRSIITDETPDD